MLQAESPNEYPTEHPTASPTDSVSKRYGDLGTGKGLNNSKSLMPVIEGTTFLDFIAKQIDYRIKIMEVENKMLNALPEWLIE